MTEDQLRELPSYKSSAAFSPVEKLVIEYAERITHTPVAVSDDLFAKLRAHFNPAQLVELTATIAWENYRARFNRAMGIKAQGFSDGGYCVLPERPAETLGAQR